MNPYIDEDLAALGEHARRFAQGRVAPGFIERDTTRVLDRGLMREMGEMGFIAPELPEQYGGQGLGCLAAGVIHEEIARADLSLSYINLLASLNGQILAKHAAPGIARPWLERLTQGRALLAIALTEPRGGSDAANLRLKMERVGGHYVLNGEKTSISAADQADAAVVFARTGSVDDGARGVSAVLVPMDLPGITRNRFDCHGQRAIGRGSIFFENVRVPADHLLGEEGKGFRYILSGMNAERILIASECVGDAKWFIRRATDYAKQRVLFGRTIGQNQGVQFPISKAYAQMRAAELMVHQAAGLYEAGQDCGAEANMAKLLAADASWAAADMCVQTHGGFGFAEEFDIERKFRETRLYQVAPISTNLILSYLAEHVLGLPRSY